MQKNAFRQTILSLSIAAIMGGITQPGAAAPEVIDDTTAIPEGAIYTTGNSDDSSVLEIVTPPAANGLILYGTKAPDGNVYGLIIDGTVLQENTNGNGVAAIRYKGRNTGFGLLLGPTGIVRAYGNADTILIDSGAEPDPNSPQPVIVNFMVLRGQATAENGAVIRYREPTHGNVVIDPTARIIGNKAIVADGNGGMTLSSSIVVKGYMEGRSGTAVDFSGAASGLTFIIDGGTVVGNVIGASDTRVEDVFVLKQGEYGGIIQGVEHIFARGDYTYGGGTPTFTGDVGSDSSGGRPELTVEGALVLGRGTPGPQSLNVDLTQNAGSRLVVELNQNSTTTAPVVITGSSTFAQGSVLQAILDAQAYSQLLAAGVAQNYKVLQLDQGITANTETALAIRSSVLLDVQETVSPGADNVVEIKVEAKPVEELEETIDKAGGGESAEDSLAALFSRALAIVKTPSAHSAKLRAEAEQIFSTIAKIPEDKAVDLVNLARESRINSNVSHEATQLVVNGTQGQVLQRLTGKAFGDEPASHGFWIQLLNTESEQDARTNDTDDKLKGYDAQSNGITFGLEQEVGDYTFGGAFTVATVEVNKKNSNDYSQLNNYQMNFYGSWQSQDWFMHSILNLGYSKHDKNRYIDGFFTTPLTSDFNSQHYGIQWTGGKSWQFGNMLFEPQIGMNYSYIKTGSYKEEDSGGTGLGQEVDGTSSQRMELGAGFGVSQVFQVGKGEIEPSFQFMVWHDVKGEQLETTSRYLLGSQKFTVKGADPEKTSYEASVNLTYRRDDAMRFILGYDHNQKTGFKSDSYYFRMKYDF